MYVWKLTSRNILFLLCYVPAREQCNEANFHCSTELEICCHSSLKNSLFPELCAHKRENVFLCVLGSILLESSILKFMEVLLNPRVPYHYNLER
jgi:hypothetical protein